MASATFALSSAALSLLLSGPAASAPGRSLEQRYLSTRDEYGRKLGKQAAAAEGQASIDRLFDDHGRALKELEKLLRDAVGPVSIEGLAGPGAINLESLLRDEVGYGLLDALRFAWGDGSLLVTTKGLLDAYARADERFPKELDALAASAAFYQQACFSDAAVTHFVELPVRPAGSTGAAKAFLAGVWQDVGPWPPDTLLVFVARGERIFVVTSQLRDRLEQLPACDARWKEYEARYDAARLPRRPGEQPDPRPEQYRDAGFEAYRQCYASALPARPSFAELTHRAQALVDRLSRTR